MFSHIFSYGCLCVVSSWGSFLISPKVLPYLQYFSLDVFRDPRNIRNMISRWFLAESAFSSLCSFLWLLFLSPQFLPRPRFHTLCLCISFIPGLGLAGTYCPDFLGSRPLPLHIRSNNCLRGAAHPHTLSHGEVQSSWGAEGSRKKGSDNRQEDASLILVSLHSLQYRVLAYLPL